jgi:hypothetical protein
MSRATGLVSWGLSMSTRQKRSNAALETCLLILFRNARDLELQLYELNKLRYQVRQAELSVRKSRRTDSEVRERLGKGQGHAALSRPRSQRERFIPGGPVRFKPRGQT